MNKRPIGIIDINVDGLYILNSLTKEFKNEDFIYINDIKNYPYEGREQEEIVKFVTENVVRNGHSGKQHRNSHSVDYASD